MKQESTGAAMPQEESPRAFRRGENVNVGELIAALERYDPNLPVLHKNIDSECCSTTIDLNSPCVMESYAYPIRRGYGRTKKHREQIVGYSATPPCGGFNEVEVAVVEIGW